MRHFMFSGLPSEEEGFGHAITSQLMNLHRMHERFAANLALYHTCQTEIGRVRSELMNTPNRTKGFFDSVGHLPTWVDIAARDGAITLWDFVAALHFLRSNLDKAPTVSALVERGAFEKVIADFHLTFPKAKKVRHAAAHPIDIYGTPNITTSNAFSGSYQGEGIKIENAEQVAFQGIDNDNVIVTIYGEMIGYSLTADSLEKLGRLKERMYDLFEPAQEALKARHLEQIMSQRTKASQDSQPDSI